MIARDSRLALIVTFNTPINGAKIRMIRRTKPQRVPATSRHTGILCYGEPCKALRLQGE